MPRFTEEFDYREHDAWNRLKDLEQKITDLEKKVDTPVSTIEPGIINLCANSDALYSQGGLAGATFANKDLSAGHWYTIASDTTTFLTEHTTTVESSQSLQDAAAAGYSNPACDWKLSTGVFRLGGGYSLIHRLPKNSILPGSRVFVQLLAKLDTGVSITSSHKLKIALVDNVSGTPARNIIKDAAFSLALQPVGGTGATTRRYVVEIITTDGTSQSAATDITNSVATLSPTQYVSISWQSHYGVKQINIYRSVDAGATWKKITGTGLTGGTSFYDTGITGTSVTLPASVRLSALSYITDFGSLLSADWTRFVLQINIPSYYSMVGSTDKQLLEISIVNSAGASVSTTNRGVLVDKVGVSYNNGIWTPAPGDQATTAPVLATSPDPGSGGSTGSGPEGPEYLPPTCFVEGTPITLPSGKTIPNQTVQVGQLVKSFHPDTLDFEPGTVTWVNSREVDNYLLLTFMDNSYEKVTDEHPFRAVVSNAPRIHNHFVRAVDLAVGDIVATESGSGEIISITRKFERARVLNFSVEPHHTYIAGHKLVHNVKISSN